MKIFVGSRKARTKEICRAIGFLAAQIKKGWSVEEAFEQVKNSYGSFINECVRYELQQRLVKQSIK